MPRNFYHSYRLEIAGQEIVPLSGAVVHYCRDLARHWGGALLFHPSTWTYIRNCAPDARREDLPLTVQPRHAGAIGTTAWRITVASYLRNPSLWDFQVSMAVSTVSLDQLAHVAEKLQQKYTTVEFSLRTEETPSTFNRVSETLHWLTLSGDAEVYTAWWWAVMLTRMSAVNQTWRDVTRLLRDTNDLALGVGTEGRDRTMSAWQRCLDRQEMSGLHAMLLGFGPVGQADARIQSVYLGEEVQRQYRNFAFDLRPQEQRPTRLVSERTQHRTNAQ
jgi:hypothetical protein